MFDGLVFLHRSSKLESSKQKAVVTMSSGQPFNNDDDSLRPSTVTRLYHPTPYSSIQLTSQSAIAAAGDHDSYSSPHYVYQHSGALGGNFFSTYCRGNTELWDPCANHMFATVRTCDEQYPTAAVDGELQVRMPGGVSTILTSATGTTSSDIGGTFYPTMLQTPDKPLFPVCVSSESGSYIARTAVESCNVESCQTCYSSNQLTPR